MDNFLNGYFKEANISFFREQIKNAEYVDLKGNVVILADRLHYLAKELSCYMDNNTNINKVEVIASAKDIKSNDYQNIDYLIIIGYLEDEKNYNVVNMLRRQNSNLKTVQWALLDDYVHSLCLTYQISFQFDRIQPVNEFIHYLCEIKDQHDNRDRIQVEDDFITTPHKKRTFVNKCIVALDAFLKRLESQ